MGFLEDIAAAKAAPKETSEPVAVIVNGTLYELVFERVDGDVWAETVSRFPPRAGSVLDKRFGYNYNAVVLEIAPKTGRLADGTTIPLEAWSDLIPALSGSEISAVTDAIWSLNEWNPAQEIEKAKKALKAGSRRKSN